MPYFYNPEKNLNLLLIHIPKTGGTSLEHYFQKKYDIPLNRDSLWSTLRRGVTPNNISFQHQPYSMIYQHKDFFKVHFTSDIKIISIVRNPYERIISDLFHFKYINLDTSREEVFEIIQKYFNTDIVLLDNHKTPQYKFVTNEKDEIIENITILKMEQLNSDMYDLGHIDYNHYKEKTRVNINTLNLNYYNYLNNSSIKAINKYYEKDFLLFGYKMK